MSLFPLEREQEILRHPEDFRLLERVPLTRPDILVRFPLQIDKRRKQKESERYDDERSLVLLAGDCNKHWSCTQHNDCIDLHTYDFLSQNVSLVKVKYSLELQSIVSYESFLFDAPTARAEEGRGRSGEQNLFYKEPGYVRGLAHAENGLVSNYELLPFFADEPLVVVVGKEALLPGLVKRCSLLKTVQCCFFKKNIEEEIERLGFFYDSSLSLNTALACLFLWYQRPWLLRNMLCQIHCCKVVS